MRMLHPVGAHEKFYARGLYQRFHLDQTMPYTESWSIHRLPDGEQFIRIDQDARADGQWSRLVEALRNIDGKLERLRVRVIDHELQAPVKSMLTDYQFSADEIDVTRQIDDQDRQYETIPTGGRYAVRLMDFTFFWGDLIQQSLNATDYQGVFVPFFKVGKSVGQMAHGGLLTIDTIRDETLLVGAKQVPVKQYITTGQRAVWLDTHQIPIRLSNAMAQTTDFIRDYAHSA